MTDKININPNQLFSAVFVKQLHETGVEDVIICAGSRSTPLTMAFTSKTGFNCYSMVDERSGAFFALGLAKYKKQPVAVLSTSGTAGANFYPAIIEAKESSIPLIVLTADRPKELRISGANQTTDQIKMFGDHVNWFVDVITPSSGENTQLLQYMQHIAVRGYQKSMFPVKGPVHLNFPFRKPLQPTSDQVKELGTEEIIKRSKFKFKGVQTYSGKISPSEMMIETLKQHIEESTFTLIIAGPNSFDELTIENLKNLADQTKGLLLLDPLSGYRYQSRLQENVILTYETMLRFAQKHLPEPDLIIQIGDMPISKYLGEWLSQVNSTWLILSSHNDSRDGVLNSSLWFITNPNLLVQGLTIDSVDQKNEVKVESWTEMERIVRKRIGERIKSTYDFEPSIIQTIINQLPESRVFVANSLMPRHFDQFIFNSEKDLTIYSSRGVSGIDGTLSTALGIAVQSDLPTFLITGDLAFYHDLNGLLGMMRYKIPLNILVINNQGGAIFDRLPIASFNPPFDEFFLTKHQLNFDQITSQYGIEYQFLDFTNMEKFDLQNYTNIISSFGKATSMVLEVKVSSSRVEEIRTEIMKYMSKIFK